MLQITTRQFEAMINAFDKIHVYRFYDEDDKRHLFFAVGILSYIFCGHPHEMNLETNVSEAPPKTDGYRERVVIEDVKRLP